MNSIQISKMNEVLSAQSISIKSLVDFDFSPAYELDEKLKANDKLLDEFIKDPSGIAMREVGWTIPDGYHLHFIDKDNNYYPPENNAISQLQKGENGKVWNRIEIRSAVGPGCIAFCGVCW